MKNASITVLGLYLKELGIEPNDIEKFEGRKMTQKAVYLAQSTGADLGYRYVWDVKGPNSPTLANDYNDLLQAYLINPKLLDNKTLIGSFTSVLHRVHEMIYSEDIPGLQTHQWVELLGSLHFLRKISEFSSRKSKSYLERVKPELSRFTSKAEAVLKEADLL